jgi:ferredoxin
VTDESTAEGSLGQRRAVVDRDVCMGSGNCVYWAPAVFRLDVDGIAEVWGFVAGNEDKVELAITNCPTRAIRLEGGEG